jgi:hypothetical protein
MLGKPLKQALIDRRLNTMMYPQNILFSDIRWGISTGNVKSADNNNCLPMMPSAPPKGMPIKSKSDYSGSPTFRIYSYDAIYKEVGRDGALTKFILDHDAGEIGDIGVVYDTAKALLRIPGDFFTVDPIQYGAQIAQEAPHSKRFQILRSAPSMDRIKALLPYRKIHPLLEEFLVSLADQPWLDRIPSEVMPDNEQPLQANAWLEEYRHHASSDRMQRLVNEWKAPLWHSIRTLQAPLSVS